MPTIPITTLRPAVDAEQSSFHLRILHGDAPGYASLNLLGNERRERHCFFSNNDLTDATDADESRTALQDVVDNRWNVYTSLSTFETVPERGRGTRASVLSVPGVWADVDVKPDVEDYFTSEDEVRAYVRHLPRPTLEIASGSGGRHLYWLTHERLSAKAGSSLLLAWLDYLRVVADGHTIENVHDTTRILRLAGTVRWPKIGEDALPRPVELIAIGPHYRAEELETYAEPAYQEGRRRRDEAKARRKSELMLQQSHILARRLPVETFLRVQQTFNATQEWQPLLEAAGWTLHSDERGRSARCRYWTRPGKSVAEGKSASTDFSGDDGQASSRMSLYTKEPTLLDLWENAETHDAIGFCSKWRFTTKCLGWTDTKLYYAVRRTGTLT